MIHVPSKYSPRVSQLHQYVQLYQVSCSFISSKYILIVVPVSVFFHSSIIFLSASFRISDWFLHHGAAGNNSWLVPCLSEWNMVGSGCSWHSVSSWGDLMRAGTAVIGVASWQWICCHFEDKNVGNIGHEC